MDISAHSDEAAIIATSGSMVRLIYKSVSQIPFSKAELDYLVIRARRNNTPKDISGMLVHADGLFLQVLEGPSQAVGRLFDNIRADYRHDSIEILSNTGILVPAFSDWSMGYANATKEELIDFAERVAAWTGFAGGDEALGALRALRDLGSNPPSLGQV